MHIENNSTNHATQSRDCCHNATKSETHPANELYIKTERCFIVIKKEFLQLRLPCSPPAGETETAGGINY